VPYVIRTTLAVLHNFDRRIEEAPPCWRQPRPRLLRGHLAAIRPGVFAGGVFAFIVSFDQFPVSLFLVSQGRDLPVVLFNYMKIRPRRRHRGGFDGLDLAGAFRGAGAGKADRPQSLR